MASQSEASLTSDINILFSLNLEKFSAILSFLETRPIRTLKPQTVIEDLSKLIPKDAAAALMRVMIHIVDAKHENPKLQVDSVLVATKKLDEIDEYDQKKEFFNRIFFSEYMQGIAKATFLSYEEDNVFLSLSSTVDIRPIFGEGKESIMGSLIMPKVKIRYYSNVYGESRSISFCADEDDISRIADALSEIIKKIRTIKLDHGDQNPELCLVSGEAKV